MRWRHMNAVPLRKTACSAWSIAVGLLLLCPHLSIADEDQVAQQPGLHCILTDGQHSVVRVDRGLNLDWSDGPPDGRLADTVTAEWTGNLLVRQPGKHTIHASLIGVVTVSIDDSDVLKASGESIFHSAVPVTLSAGDHQIKVRLHPLEPSTGNRKHTGMKLQLFWSSPDFTLEPIPAELLTHEPADASLSLAEHGRFLADALRCSACHAGLAELPSLKAPDLTRVSARLSTPALIARLMALTSGGSHSAMPSFGFSANEAADVTAFLNESATKDRSPDDRPLAYEPDDVIAGEKLLTTTGCVACHAVAQMPVGFEPAASPYHGPDLTDVKARRSGPWLMKWLKSPETLNVDHRMPVFALSDDDRRGIVAALLQRPAGSEALIATVDVENPATRESIDRGRQFVVAANCAGCHRMPGIESVPSQRPRPTADSDFNGAKSCLARDSVPRPPEGRNRLPRFALSDLHRDQISAWLQSIPNNLRTASGAAWGELLLHRNGCLACHDRDQQRGLSSIAASIEARRDDLRGQSQALIPPALTAVGDKLREEYLTEAVAGEQKSRRLPWLLVRMPKFRMSKEDRSALVRHFVSSDRIPDDADEARPELFEHLNPHHPSLATAEELLAGNLLVGAGGFNCIACHQAGEYEPRNVAMGTRGSDIMTMGQRLRPRFFMRWMQNPIRVLPGIEMPAIRKPVAGVLDDSLPQQIATLWKALADPEFSPPTVVSRFEQIVTVLPGERPRVIRDVFTIGDKKNRDSVARAFAVGFSNGHSALIDLDSFNLRQWTIGEFARQRTEGKSWFWDMAGIPVFESADDGPFCHLTTTAASSPGEAWTPVIDERRQAELLSYETAENDVSLLVRFRFEPKTAEPQSAASSAEQRKSPHSSMTAWNDPSRPLVTVVVRFTLQALATQHGWSITALMESCPDEYRLNFDSWVPYASSEQISFTTGVTVDGERQSTAPSLGQGQSAELTMQTSVKPPVLAVPTPTKSANMADRITAVPGFTGRRLPIDSSIMPTGMTWIPDGRMAFTSLRGQVWIASDTDNDHLPDSTSLFADGLAAPFGIRADGNALLVAHKPEVLHLRDADKDGRADQFDVVASGWGLTDDYHDWTTGLIRDSSGNLFVGLGSDYSQDKRPVDNDRWRGTVLKIDSTGAMTPIAFSLRFPMGLALDRDENLFATDNQGVQNTFNEINHVIPGRHYGVPSRHETDRDAPAEIPSLMIPHPWTRSVNSILFLPEDFAVADLAGHGIGCEFDTRCLIRFTLQDVDGTLQGACYRFSVPDQPGGGSNFVGPISSAVGPDGAVYIGSIWDSGWQGGSNTGSIERLVPDGPMPNGIREIRATSSGFVVSFFRPVDPRKASDADNWSLQSYTKVWSGNYASPDSDRHTLTPSRITLADDRRSVVIEVAPLKPGYVYEVSIRHSLDESKTFWPSEGHYSMKRVPK